MAAAVHIRSIEERVWSAVAHASSLLLFLGTPACALIWSTQRAKSPHVAFQALQALGFQVISFMLWFLVALLLPFLLLPLILAEVSVLANGAPTEDFFPFASMFITWGSFFALLGLYFLLALIGAGMSLAGRNFFYPVLGKWLRRYLRSAEPGASGNPLDESRAERWVAAMSHATVILTIWGMLLPLIVWLTESRRSPLLRFQALQALVFQGIQTVLFFGSYALYTITMLAFFGITLTATTLVDDPGGLFPLAMIFMLIVMLFVLGFMLLFPLLQVLGQWAALRVAQGRDYHYPLLGGWLHRRLERSPAARP
jgi:uncharacterized Tic20 family protein